MVSEKCPHLASETALSTESSSAVYSASWLSIGVTKLHSRLLQPINTTTIRSPMYKIRFTPQNYSKSIKFNQKSILALYTATNRWPKSTTDSRQFTTDLRQFTTPQPICPCWCLLFSKHLSFALRQHAAEPFCP